MCFWNVRFLRPKLLIPNDFYKEFSLKILLTRRILSIYGIKDELNFYNNLEFDGAQLEENNAKEFIAEWAKYGYLFLENSCLEVPNISDSKDESSKIPKEIPFTAYLGNAFNYKDKYENAPFISLPNPSASSASISTPSLSPEPVTPSVSILTPSPPPRPFTPESESEHEDFHDHPIPLNQMAQKIPRLLDIEINPSSLGNL